MFRPRNSAIVRLALFASVVGSAAPARAQEGGVAMVRASLEARFGRKALERRLGSDAVDVRMRAIRRLGALGGAWAADQLEAYGTRSRLRAREWLAVARAAAPAARYAAATRVLSRIVAQRPASASTPPDAARLRLAAGTAALGLARHGSDRAVGVLARALRSGGHPAVVSADALLAYPPQQLSWLRFVSAEPSAEVAVLLGRLGDQRAFHLLRDWVRGASADVRAAAAIALTQLGHLETVPLARDWLASGLPALSDAALEILMHASHPAGVAELHRRLAVDPRDREASRLARVHSRSALSTVLLDLSHQARPPSWVWAALGRLDEPPAAQRLGGALEGPWAFEAAHALSRSASPGARRALESALRRRVALPLSLRAAALAGGETGGVESALAAVGGADSSGQATRDWVLSWRDPSEALRRLTSGDAISTSMAAQHVLSLDTSVVRGALSALVSLPQSAAGRALGALLARRSVRDRAPTSLLLTLVHDQPAARPLALRALAERDHGDLRPLLEGHLAGADPLMRAHVARGLGASSEPGVVGLLIERLELDVSTDVRWASVASLGERWSAAGSERARTALRTALRFDPSERVRSAARLALAGASLADGPRAAGRGQPRDAYWFRLRSARGGFSESKAPGRRRAPVPVAVLLSVSPGLAIPFHAGPLGLVVASGVGRGELGIRLIWREHSF